MNDTSKTGRVIHEPSSYAPCIRARLPTPIFGGRFAYTMKQARRSLLGATLARQHTLARLLAVTITALTLVGMAAVTQAAPVRLRVGIVPQAAATKLAETWKPLLAHLSETTGLDLRFATAKNIPTFEARLAKGEYDVAYMNPYHYTVFHEKPGYEAIAHAKNTKLRGLIVVHKDSPIQDVAGLAGIVVGFPAPNAFAATIIPLAYLQNQKVTVMPRYLGSHDSVYLNVAQQRVPAGGGIVQTLGKLPEEIKSQLKVLWMSDSYTPHALAVHPRVSADVVQKLTAALIGLDADPHGRELLSEIGLPGFEAAADAQWDGIRALHINLLEPLLKE